MEPELPKCTEIQFRILAALDPAYDIPARSMAEKVWPPVPSKVLGKRNGQWQSMGAQLARLEKAGLAYHRRTTTHVKLWNITKLGRKVLENKT